MTALIEIAPGTWVRPDQVTAIASFDDPPQVKVYIAGRVAIGWEFKTWADAVAWAAKITTALNQCPA